MTIYRWREISNVQDKPGVYAWYYTPEITDFDLQKIVAEVNLFKAEGDNDGATNAVRKFLHETIFRYFQEEPYRTTLRGPLKPKYEGLLEHQPSLSETLIERLVEEPHRLHAIKQVLECSAPYFASPIYIGMSDDLRKRLSKHKALIERYMEMSHTYKIETNTAEGEQRDHSFAREICTRKIPPSRLFVVVQTTDGPNGEYVDIENILNRIHYPLFGRN